jgi:hypothetical protein
MSSGSSPGIITHDRRNGDVGIEVLAESGSPRISDAGGASNSLGIATCTWVPGAKP